MLSTSEKISTASEPWILLPFLYTLKLDGAISEYWHHIMVKAVKEFYGGFPRQKDDYLSEIKKFIMNLYAKRTDANSLYFLDKTPRYHLVCEEIIELFPDSKFIFLWRNPLAVVASMINSWTKGNWKITYFKVDLYKGISNLVDTFKKYEKTVYALQYENLLKNPTFELCKICDYLDIEYCEEMKNSFASVKLDGQMGDKLGVEKYNRINLSSIDSWPNTYNNSYRRFWARQYLKWIGKERLSILGFKNDELLQMLYTMQGNGNIGIIRDLLRGGFHFMHNKLSPVLKTKRETMW